MMDLVQHHNMSVKAKVRISESEKKKKKERKGGRTFRQRAPLQQKVLGRYPLHS